MCRIFPARQMPSTTIYAPAYLLASSNEPPVPFSLAGCQLYPTSRRLPLRRGHFLPATTLQTTLQSAVKYPTNPSTCWFVEVHSLRRIRKRASFLAERELPAGVRVVGYRRLPNENPAIAGSPHL